MNRTIWPKLIVLTAVSFATPSEACRVSLTPQEQLASDYKAGVIATVTLVQVTKVSLIDVVFVGGNSWQASASVQRVLRGAYPERTMLFDQGPSICNRKYPLPSIGDQWVVFLSKNEHGDQIVREAYPADVAYAADPSLYTVDVPLPGGKGR